MNVSLKAKEGREALASEGDRNNNKFIQQACP